MTQKREMFLMPQAVVEKIAARYGYGVLGELSYLLSCYCRYWDENGNGEGFNLSSWSEVVVIYFDMIRPEVDEKHRQFMAQGAQMAKAAQARWGKEARKENLRARKRKWYVDNSEKVNQKKRKKRSEKHQAQKNNVSSHASSHRPQSKADKGVARNDAYAYRNYEIMNKKNIKEIYDIGGCGYVDNFVRAAKCPRDPPGSLAGHNLAQGSVVKGIHKNEEHKKPEERRNSNSERQTPKREHNPPQPCGQLPRGEQRLGRDVERPASARPTVYGDTWVRIGDDFEVDLFDPMFERFARARKFLLRGFEMWCRKKLCGERHDKWWLVDQLGRNFANRQGDTAYMTKNERRRGENA